MGICRMRRFCRLFSHEKGSPGDSFVGSASVSAGAGHPYTRPAFGDDAVEQLGFVRGYARQRFS
jgi:hypothetical protein